MAGHPVERGAVAHRVVTTAAVDVDVDEARSEVGEGRVGGAFGGRVVEVDRRDDAVRDGHAPDGDAIVEDQAPDESVSCHARPPLPL